MPSGIVDNATGISVSLTGDHHYIHKGLGYVLNGNSASIAAGAVEHISFKTPVASKAVIHFRPAIVASSANSLSVTIVENAVMTGGTAATPRNCNRLNRDASSVVIATGATLTTAGNGGTIFLASVGSGGASNQVGGMTAGDNERVLKPDTMYSITFTNTGATTATVAYYQLFWYEEK